MRLQALFWEREQGERAAALSSVASAAFVSCYVTCVSFRSIACVEAMLQMGTGLRLSAAETDGRTMPPRSGATA